MNVPPAPLGAKRVVFLLRTVDPVDRIRLTELDHFIDPTQQVLVAAEGSGGISFFHVSHRRYRRRRESKRKAAPPRLEEAIFPSRIRVFRAAARAMLIL
jgi:hypothetical protein